MAAKSGAASLGCESHPLLTKKDFATGFQVSGVISGDNKYVCAAALVR